MVSRADRIVDLESVLAAEADFVDDPTDQGWLTATAAGERVYVRMGDFPDEDLWSLWLGDGRWMEFTVPPARWNLRVRAARWSADARERLPKNEFHD